MAKVVILTGEEALALAQIVQAPQLNPQTGMPMPFSYEQYERIEAIIQSINEGLGDYFTETEAVENDHAERRAEAESDELRLAVIADDQRKALAPIHRKYKDQRFNIVLEGREFEYTMNRVKSGGGIPAGGDTKTRRVILAIGKALDAAGKVGDGSSGGPEGRAEMRPFVPREQARRQRQAAAKG